MEQQYNRPEIVVEYTDPLEGFKGWLVIDRLAHQICAGGMRVQPGLRLDHLCEMARNMTLKMRIAGLRVDGAKCGIDYDPDSPGKSAAVSRFINAISPYIKEIYSMGPDLNTDMAELETAAAQHSIPSVKMAIARAQGWRLDYFLERNRLLSESVDGFTLGRLRAGYGVAAAVLAVLKFLNIDPPKATIAIQGFGNLAKATLFGLDKAGCIIIAISDAEKCMFNARGIDIKKIIGRESTLLPSSLEQSGVGTTSNTSIFDCKCDILVPAAVENTVTPGIAEKLQVKGVVPGANLAVPRESDMILYHRNIPVLPDFLAGCGGSLSMEGLFGPDSHPTVNEVLNHIDDRMRELVKQVTDESGSAKCSLREAALRLCAKREVHPNCRPYGRPD